MMIHRLQIKILERHLSQGESISVVWWRLVSGQMVSNECERLSCVLASPGNVIQGVPTTHHHQEQNLCESTIVASSCSW